MKPHMNVIFLNKTSGESDFTGEKYFGAQIMISGLNKLRPKLSLMVPLR